MNDLSWLQKEFGDLTPWIHGPDFWPARPDRGMPFLEKLREAKIRTIGQSAGGRPIVAVEYGEKEPLETTSVSLHSSIASKAFPADPTDIFPASFYGQRRRKKPVLAIQGGIHGSELSGTAASLNLCQVIETGRDLRGKPWPKLQELARASRIVLIPWLNMDGVLRCPIAHFANAPKGLSTLMTGGRDTDGQPFEYPIHKNLFPIPVARASFLGAYFNDNGVNLQYDFCLPRRQPETAAWMEYYLDERPDGILIWHCNGGTMFSSPDYYLPEGFQHEFSRLGGAVRGRLLREGYEIGRLSYAGLPGMGRPYLDQITATYHVCGGMPIMCEMPMGCEPAVFTCEQILEIGLISIEEVLFYAHRDGLRPYELWDKVKKQMAHPGGS